MPKVKLVGTITSIDSYESQGSGVVNTVSVGCQDKTFAVRVPDPAPYVEDMKVVVLAKLQMHAKGAFLKNEVIRIATADEIAEFKMIGAGEVDG